MSSVTIKLKSPIQFGKQSPLIEELVLKPTARAFKEFSLPMTSDGKIDYQPYQLAAVGVRMAGQPNPVVDQLGVEDMIEVANAVLGFFGTNPNIGKTPLPA